MNRSLVNSDQTDSDQSEQTESAECSSCLINYKQGEALANIGNYAEALTIFDQIIALQPDHDAAWVFRGVVLIHLGRYQEALLSCDRAIEIYPANPEAWVFRGVALHRLGRYSEAYASYDRATNQKTVSPWQKLKQTLKQRGVSLFWKPLL